MKISITILLLSLQVISYGQVKKLIEKANMEFSENDYLNCIDDYRTIYQRSKDFNIKYFSVKRIAESFYNLHQYRNAKLFYSKLIIIQKDSSDIVNKYADLLKQTGEYQKAISYYNDYAIMTGNNVNIFIKSCDTTQFINKRKANIKSYIFNSKYPDYCLFRYGNIDYFASERDTNKGDILNRTTQKNGNIYTVENGNIKPLPGIINTSADEGAVTRYQNELYFTRCMTKEKKTNCKIYVANILSGKYVNIHPLFNYPDSINIKQPAITTDGTRLYFSSDKSGGNGGFDIYETSRVTRSSSWTKPVNVSNINTKYNEAFPTVNDSCLYFSSDKPEGMGGLDIYCYNLKSGKIKNIGIPYNSGYDDYGYSDIDKWTGFFTSNRPSTHGQDDIYTFTKTPFNYSILAALKDNNTLHAVPNVEVKIFNQGKLIQTLYSDTAGKIKFSITEDKTYVLKTRKENYLNNKVVLETNKIVGKGEKEIYIVPVTLLPKAKPIELPNILYDLAKWDLRPESKTSLDQLVETLSENPNIKIELMSHTDYRGTKKSNDILSQKRAQSVVDYLISKGVAAERLVAKGYGEIQPKIIDEKTNASYPQFKVGLKLTEKYIKTLSPNDQKAANQINRRTEFRVIK